MECPVIIKPAIARQFQTFLERGRVFFFSAPCGFGKSALAEALLDGKRVRRAAVGLDGFVPPDPEEDWEVLLVDDLQLMQEENDCQTLCTLVRESPERRFVLLSRGAPPGWLAAFQYAGLMTVVRADAMLFGREEIVQMLRAYGVEPERWQPDAIRRESIGYPLGVAITARRMAEGSPFDQALVDQSLHEVFLYFETAVYHRFDLPIRRFLLELASFERFDLTMAKMVSGDPRVGEMLDWLQRNTTMLRYDGRRQFHFWPQFRQFLLWEMERECSEEKRRALYSRGGMYYELHEDYPHALECYTRGGDHSKVSELLIRNAELHPGMGHYSEMERYYRSLPEEEILASPALMQGMSMLCALSTDYADSERWYEALKRFAQRCGRQDPAGKQARSRLAWLDISLPQRGVERLTETIPAVFQLLRNREVTLPPFSVTSGLPSLMNGGKDVSPWSKKDELLYATLRVPVEAVLGRDGVGLADCALAESKFEKGEDISRRMLALVPRMGEIQRDGTPDMEFAVTGLLARSQLAAGQPDDARRTVLALRERFAELGCTRFLPNMDALLCRIDLHTGHLERADAWYREKAPRDLVHLNVMRRYQYLTQAMVELADGRPAAALLTLSPLVPYSDACDRYIAGIHLNVVCAIARYRQKDGAWRETLLRALETAAEFQFIRTVSVYGGAVLPLLEKTEWSGDPVWWRRLLAEVRTQTAYYPDFLRTRLAPSEELTATELQILRLVCADKSNGEIGRIMDIKLSTVKTHVSHILDKLGVSRRSEAKTAAKKLKLLPEEL